MAQPRRHDGTPVPRRLDRRSILMASAGLAAASVLGRQPTAGAQWTGTTVAGEWVEAQEVGILVASGIGGEYTPEPISFQADFAFQGIAPHWDIAENPGAGIELSLSTDGVNWTDPVWVVESSDGGRPDREGRRFGRLVPANWASFVRYRAYDAQGVPATLPGLAFSYFDAANGPTMIEAAQPALTPSLAEPPIISRAAWGADESLRFNDRGRETWPVEYQAVQHAIIHHTDTTNFEDPVLGLRLIYYYHAVTRGWGDIGYNYLVDFMGNVYEGRFGGETAVGSHALQYNWGSAGIGTMGRYFNEPVTPEMRSGLTWITAWACRALDPLATPPFQNIASLPTICAHRDVNTTSCPGDAMYAEIVQMRQAVQAVIAGTVEAAPPSPGFLPGDMVVTSVEGGLLRDMPTNEANVLIAVSLGEVLTIQDGPATNDGAVWYQVRGTSLTGWMTSDALVLGGEPASAPVEDAAAPPPDENGEATAPVG
ncbi:MAG: peptidoglycan recognition protein family protein [Chloroflexota bacterium]|nr:peptidoglycan recognition protein family protein [Chloroflexota bacterium]